MDAGSHFLGAFLCYLSAAQVSRMADLVPRIQNHLLSVAPFTRVHGAYSCSLPASARREYK